MSDKPNVTEKVFSGVGAQELPIPSQYFNSVITIIGLATGVMTVRAKASENPVFEDVLNGEIRLDKSRTLTIRNTQIDAFEFVVDLSAVSFIASRGIGLLLKASKKVAEKGRSLALTGLRPQVRRALETLGVFTAIPEYAA